MKKGDRYTPEQRRAIRALYDQTEPRLSHSRIAAIVSTWPGMGRVTKGAIIGMAARDGWPPREDTIRRPFTEAEREELRAAFADRSKVLDVIVAELRQRNARYQHLTPLALKGLARTYGWPNRAGMPQARWLAPRRLGAAPVRPPQATAPRPMRAAVRVAAAVPVPAAEPAQIAAPAPEAAPGGTERRPCEWPMSDPRAEGFRWCGCASVRSWPFYCAEHVARAYEPRVRPGAPAGVQA